MYAIITSGVRVFYRDPEIQPIKARSLAFK